MGEFKPLLPVGGVPILRRSIELFKRAGVEDVIVTTGLRADEIEPLIERWGGRPVRNEEFERGMYSSVQAGAAALSHDTDAFFMLPVDIPLVRSVTVHRLLRRFAKQGGSVVYPVFQGRRGHPPLIAAEHIDRILAYSGDGGLKAVLSEWTDEADSVETPDEHIHFDIDTPEDYASLLDRYERYTVPTAGELEILIRAVFNLSDDPFLHGRKVARLALRLTDALERCGIALDADLVLAAAFLHDIAKGRPDHAAVGAEILREMGFAAVGDVVAVHTDFAVDPNARITEAEVVYFSDKLVRRDRMVPLEERFAEAKRKCGDSAAAYEALLGRFENAVRVRRRLGAVLGRSPESIMRDGPNGREDERISSVLVSPW